MPRKKKPESPAGLEAVIEQGQLKTADQLPSPPELEPLKRSRKRKATVEPETPRMEPEARHDTPPPNPQGPIHERNGQPNEAEPPFEPGSFAAKVTSKTVRPFIGRVASGNGRIIHADDSSFAIEALTPLTEREAALATKHGFDEETLGMHIADKRTMRQVDGDINYVARVLTENKDEGRNR